MAYWSFLENIMHGRPIRIFNHGRNRRDFTYIDDIVGGVIASLTSTGPDSYEIINLGNSNPVKLKRLVEVIEGATGKKAKIVREPLPKGDVSITFADISKAKRILNYEPKVSIDDGMRDFVVWFKANRM